MTEQNTGADVSAADDLNAFEADFYGTSEPKTPEAPTPEPEQPVAADNDGEGEASQEGAEGGEAPPKPKKTAGQRIDELTYRAKEAERGRQAAEDELAALKAGKEPEAQPNGLAEGEPDPEDYEFGEEDRAYIRDWARFELRREVEAEVAAQTEQRRSITETVSAFEGKAKVAFPDGEPEGLKTYRTTRHNSPLLNEVVMTSENGPQVAAYYGENKDALQRLSAMSPHMQAYEIAKVEARLTASSETATPQPKPKTVTDAPEPAPKVRGAGGQFSVQGDTDDQEAFEREFYRRP